MKKYERIIGVRLSTEERDRIEQLVWEGKFGNISQVIRASLIEFLKNHEVN